MKTRKILSSILALLMLLSTLTVGMTVQAKLPFNDTDGHWGEAAIEYVVEKGLMNGVGNGESFAPDMSLTRAMVVTVLYRDNGSPKMEYRETFLDVPKDQYYTAAAEWAYEKNIVNGTGTDDWGVPYFSPDRDITRQELATMFARYAEYKHVDVAKSSADISSFPDAGNVADWAGNAVKWAVGTGLITGKTNGGAATLAPTDKAVRAEFATIIKRFKEAKFDYLLAYEAPVPMSTYTAPDYPLVKDADIYVAVDGNDQNPGTLAKPLATFEAAKAKVREIIKTGKTGEIVVAFKAGDYGILDNIQFSSEDSGNENLTITYCAYGDGEVYFTNGVYIEEDKFEPLEESDRVFFPGDNYNYITKVDLSVLPNTESVNSFSPLSSSTGFCWLARTPNKKNGVDAYYPGFTKHVLLESSPYYGNMDKFIEDMHNGVFADNEEVSTHIDHYKLQTLRILRERLDTIRTLENVQLVGYIGKVWHQDAHNLTSYDKETGIVSYSNGPVYSFYATVDGQQQAYLNNVSEELDDEGEYWIDPATKTLYVYKAKGAYTMATAEKFVSVHSNVNYITMRKLNFRSCSGNGFEVYGNNFTFDQGSIKFVGGSYAFLAKDSLNIKFTNSEVAYCAESGICIEAIRGRNVPGYYALENTGCVIRNNLVHDVDMQAVPVESGAIRFSYQVGADVSHNEVYNSARYGIDFKYGNVDCVMEYNYLHHCMTNSADGGAFYCGRVATNRGNIVRYNIVSEIIALNPVHIGGTFAIYLDDGMENLIVYGNVFYKSGQIMNNSGRDHEFYDNVFIGKTSGIFGKDANYRDITRYGDHEFTDNFAFNEGWNGLDRVPAEGTPNGEKWKEKWPELYDILAIWNDPTIDVTKLDYYSKPLNYCHNNYTIDGAEHNFAPEWVEYSDHENNVEIAKGENPFFVNPAIGDYSLKAGAPIMDNHYAEIGRY